MSTSQSEDSTHQVDKPENTEELDVPEFSLEWKEKIVFASLMCTAFFTSFEAVGVGPPLPIIAQSLHGTSVQASWVGTGYFVGSSAFQPLFASFSHIFGRKIPTLTALLLFLIGTILCSVAHSMPLFLAGRVIQGVGSGGAIAMVDVLITDLIPLRQRAMYFGFVSLAWAFGTTAGPLAGSSLAQKVTWRWVFWILLPFNVISILAVALFLRLRRKERELSEKFGEIDFVGSLLFIASTAAFLLGILFGGVQYPWKSFHTLLPLVLGAVGLVGFAFYEAMVPKHPVIPMELFASTTSAAGYLGIVTTGMTMWAAVYYLPMYYEAVLSYSFVMGAVALLPLTLTVSPAAVVTGGLVTKMGKYRTLLWIGWAITVMGTGLIIYLKEGMSPPQWIFITLIPGLGIGMLLSTMQIAVQAAAKEEYAALAAAMVPELRTYGQAIGLAIFSASFSNVVKNHLEQSVVLRDRAAELSNDVFTLVQTIKSQPNGAEKEALIKALWLGTRSVWIIITPILAVIAILSFFARDLNLDRVLLTEHVVPEETKVERKTNKEP
ncbi:Major facilitator superfamily domain, general substrate transporter [Penicillium occitanis (nom. inval.)]|nr:hypothetical protein PENOC_069580 [Penicillium occitanis (nom. inval.)]PCG98329.1 Major facilitator superfamily domain, general substrate transporter [Penicillium occitanis (nom. inval.)]